MFNLSSTNVNVALTSTSKPILFLFNIINTLVCPENNKTSIVNKEQRSIEKSNHQKKQKNVKFSKNVKIYFIPPIDEFKECLPNMYWNFDNKEDIFIPLKHMEFVYELKNSTDNNIPTKDERKIINSPAKKPVSLQRPYIYSIINKNFAEFEYKNEIGFPAWSNITLTPVNPTKEVQNTPSSSFVINEKPNSLPYFFNEFSFNDEKESLRIIPPPPLFLYETILQSEIPLMFKGLSCYRIL